MKLLTKHLDSIYLCDDRATRGNVGVIATDTGNYVIDTGMFPKTGKIILDDLNEIGNSSDKLAGTITTHYHLDHTGGNQIFAHKPIYAHKLAEENFGSYSQEQIEKNWINDDTREDFEGFSLTGANSVYSEDVFSPPENNDIVCYLVGGHTSGSVIIHYKPENVVFAGDNLFAGLFPWGGDKTASPYQWIKAMEKIKSFNPTLVSPGHGSMQEDVSDVDNFRNYLVKVIETTKEMLKDNKSDEEIYSSLMSLPYHDPPRALMKENSIKHWIQVIKDSQ